MTMNEETKKLWRWVFGSFDTISQPPPFHPAKAEAVFRRYDGSVLFLTAIRSRGLWLRMQDGKSSAMTAVMEVAG